MSVPLAVSGPLAVRVSAAIKGFIPAGWRASVIAPASGRLLRDGTGVQLTREEALVERSVGTSESSQD